MNVNIELSDGQAAALKVQAEAQGLKVERWLERIAAQIAPSTSIAHLQETDPPSGLACFTNGPRLTIARRRF